MSSLKDKVALVTGGGTGIGLGVARALHAEGVKIMLAGRRGEILQKAALSMGDETRVATHVADVGNRKDAEALARATLERFGRIDILVSAAGINIKTRSMETMTPDQWDEVMRVNATGAYNCLYYVLPAMRAQKDGLVINVSSISGKRALTLGGVAYCASKFAMAALGTTVGNEETKNGIRITNLYPGEVNTPILDHRPVPVPDERKAQMVQPDDVGVMVVAIAKLPPTAHVSEIVIKPSYQEFV